MKKKIKYKILQLGKKNLVKIVDAKTGKILTHPISFERAKRIIEATQKKNMKKRRKII